MMAKKQGTKKKAAGRKKVPYALIAKMVQEGADALSIAKRIGRVNAGGDSTHTVRAITSRMRSKGWEDENGKLHKLKVERVGGQSTRKPVKKAGKQATKKPAPKSITAPARPDGKTLSTGKDE